MRVMREEKTYVSELYFPIEPTDPKDLMEGWKPVYRVAIRAVPEQASLPPSLVLLSPYPPYSLLTEYVCWSKSSDITWLDSLSQE